MNIGKILLIFLLNFIICFQVSGKGEDAFLEKYMKDIPVYPEAKVYDLKDTINIRMKVHVTEDSFEKVSQYYLSKFLNKGWKVEFPDKLELKIWMEALERSKDKPQNLMLILNNPKTKIKCNITIGVVKDARLANNLTIITVYLTDSLLK